jgi:hypothetical protein
MKPSRLYRLFLIILPLSLAMFFCSTTDPRKCISLKKAEGIVFSQILENNIEGIVVYKLQIIVDAGSLITNIDEEYKVEEDSWFFFIDDAPGDRWKHPCRYVFIDCKNSAYKIINEGLPPDNFDSLSKIDF